MNAKWKSRMPWAVAAAVVVVALIVVARWQPARAASDDAPVTGPHYTVVETEGHNLIVTDNKTNMLYFYTIDKEAKVGSPLHLRGKLDLKQVGSEMLKPTNVKLPK